jgi:hypothetical protein
MEKSFIFYLLLAFRVNLSTERLEIIYDCIYEHMLDFLWRMCLFMEVIQFSDISPATNLTNGPNQRFFCIKFLSSP